MYALSLKRLDGICIIDIGRMVYINPSSPEHFPEHIFQRGVVATPLRIINMECHITLNLLPVYSYGCFLSIESIISTVHQYTFTSL